MEKEWQLQAARRAEATAAALASEAHRLESALFAAAAAKTPAAKSRGAHDDASLTLPQISPNGSRTQALTTTLANGLSPSSASTGALETNAALHKLARETLAHGHGRGR